MNNATIKPPDSVYERMLGETECFAFPVVALFLCDDVVHSALLALLIKIDYESSKQGCMKKGEFSIEIEHLAALLNTNESNILKGLQHFRELKLITTRRRRNSLWCKLNKENLITIFRETREQHPDFFTPRTQLFVLSYHHKNH
jgi:hypothetical protein